MDKYLVKKAEEVTSSKGNKYKRVILESVDNRVFEVSIWPDFPKYAEAVAGNFIEGEITVKGKYKNLVDPFKASPKFSGAKKGLEQKINYWKDKDFRTEFSIVLGQAVNLAAQSGDNSQALEEFKFWFKFILEQRKDQDNVDKFMRYWLSKTNFEEEMAKKYSENKAF